MEIIRLLESTYRMETLDIKTIIAEEALAIEERPLTTRPGYIREELWSLVWEKCVQLLNNLYGGCEHLAIEKAICDLHREGLLKDKIVYRNGSFFIKLKNAEYWINKNGATGIASACPWPGVKRCQILFSGVILGNLIQTFDEAISVIDSYIPGILKKVQERELEEKKLMMELEIKRIIKSMSTGVNQG